jgi:hypothetical protein
MADNEAVVRQGYESFLKGDIESLLGLLDPAIRWTVPRTVPQGGEFEGIEEMRTFFHGLGAAWRPLGLEIEALGAVGPDLVVGIVTISGTLAGAEVSYGSVHVFTVAGGKITRFKEYIDLDGALAG